MLTIADCRTHRDTTLKLGRKAEDLEDVRHVVNVLNEVGCSLM